MVTCPVCRVETGDLEAHLHRVDSHRTPVVELQALIEADQLSLLPDEALIASIKWLAAELLRAYGVPPYEEFALG
jgi:hypothetical protein